MRKKLEYPPGVYTALKPRHRRTLTIVIESVGKYLYLKRHLALYNEIL